MTRVDALHRCIVARWKLFKFRPCQAMSSLQFTNFSQAWSRIPPWMSLSATNNRINRISTWKFVVFLVPEVARRILTGLTRSTTLGMMYHSQLLICRCLAKNWWHVYVPENLSDSRCFGKVKHGTVYIYVEIPRRDWLLIFMIFAGVSSCPGGWSRGKAAYHEECLVALPE